MIDQQQSLRQAVAVFDYRSSLENARQHILQNDAQYTESTVMLRAGAIARRRSGMTTIGCIGECDYILASRGRLSAFLVHAGAGPQRPFDDLLISLLPVRQADFLSGCLQKDAVAFWVDVTESDIEILVYRALKAYSDYPVGIHDLRAPLLVSGAAF